MILYEGSCHCGGIAFDVEGDLTSAIECNCSMCRRRGGLLAFVARDKLTLKTPADNVATYRFNKHKVDHHFCATCGIAPFGEGKAPDGTAMASVNLRCVPAVDLATLDIQTFDGASY